DRHGAGARQDRLTEPDLQHSPPGDARTARRGMKVMESSAVFQPKQRAEKGSREDGNQSKAGHRTWGPIGRQNRPLFEVPFRLSSLTPSSLHSFSIVKRRRAAAPRGDASNVWLASSLSRRTLGETWALALNLRRTLPSAPARHSPAPCAAEPAARQKNPTRGWPGLASAAVRDATVARVSMTT